MSYLQDSCGMLNKARRRWRLAYSVINSVRTLISVSTRRVAKNNTINVPNKRWRVAVTAIYSLRAIASLSREVVAQNNHHLLHSPSFVAIHIDPDLFFSDVDTTSCITKLVKHKDLDTLHQLGGIDGIVMSLQTDERKGVNGNHQDISRRQKAFGCNSESHKWRSLENRLINLTTFMSIVGLSVAVFTLINLLVRFFSGHIKSRDGSMIFVVGKTRLSDALASEVGILVSTVAVASSAIPEGLPLAAISSIFIHEFTNTICYIVCSKPL
ncbi:hypothetical protein RJT34_24326 [Clitoria ternatea]|uniref:Uncharacterized protein n=1 Tax=Clitoria ternatea TaxID=43366 RepID=A0AAN9IHX4_CLITE